MTSCQREIRSCWHFFSVRLPANNKLHQVLPQPYVTYVCLPIVNRSSYVHDRSHPIFDRSFDVVDRLALMSIGQILFPIGRALLSIAYTALPSV